MHNQCFICEESILLDIHEVYYIHEVYFRVYSINPSICFYFHKECFPDLGLKKHDMMSGEISKCSICCCDISVSPFYTEQVTIIPKVFTDLWKDNGYYRICKDCWYSEIDIPLSIESGA